MLDDAKLPIPTLRRLILEGATARMGIINPTVTWPNHTTIVTGVVAFAPSLADCAGELRATLEDWVLLGMKLAHPLPVIAGIDLNQKPVHEPADTL